MRILPPALGLTVALTAALAVTPASADVVVERTAPSAEHRPSAAFLQERSDVPAEHHGRYHVTYTVIGGDVRASELARFRTVVHATLTDERGWSARGAVRFERVAQGGDFTLWLASPSVVAAADPACSESYSCRVGDDVYVNVVRWREGADAYRGRPLREYREYVVNHEVGHWLELGHRGCPEADAPAPVMKQQSKGLGPCAPGPWPGVTEQAAALAFLEISHRR